MTSKYPLPFVLSGTTVLMMACLSINKLHAVEHEAPAILNFATSYLQQKDPLPKFPSPSSLSEKPAKTVTPPLKKSPVTSQAVRGQLGALQTDIGDKDRKLAKKIMKSVHLSNSFPHLKIQ